VPRLVHEVEALVDASERALGAARLVNLVTAGCRRIDVVVATRETVASTPRYGEVRRATYVG
jgi:elongation factor P--beta-lysine ligase